MAGSRAPRRPSGLDIGRLTAELHTEAARVPSANKDMRRWKSREGKALRQRRINAGHRP